MLSSLWQSGLSQDSPSKEPVLLRTRCWTHTCWFCCSSLSGSLLGVKLFWLLLHVGQHRSWALGAALTWLFICCRRGLAWVLFMCVNPLQQMSRGKGAGLSGDTHNIVPKAPCERTLRSHKRKGQRLGEETAEKEVDCWFWKAGSWNIT